MQELLSFLRHIDSQIPAELDVHLIVDNYATHKHAREGRIYRPTRSRI